MSYMILTMDKEGELPRERGTVETFKDARDSADAYIREGKYAAGAKRILHGRAEWGWRYLTSRDHGSTIPELAERHRRLVYDEPALPMQGNPVGDGAKQ